MESVDFVRTKLGFFPSSGLDETFLFLLGLFPFPDVAVAAVGCDGGGIERSPGLAILVLLLRTSSFAPSLSSLILAASSFVGFCRSGIGEISVVAGGGGAAEAVGSGIAVTAGEGVCTIVAGEGVASEAGGAVEAVKAGWLAVLALGLTYFNDLQRGRGPFWRRHD
jgi:hypothetical protein